MIDDVRLHPAMTHVVTAPEAQALEQVAETLRVELTPAPADKIMAVIGKLSIAFPRQTLSNEEADVRLEQYAEGLDDIPADVLASAYRLALRTYTFFPTIAEIRAVCHGIAQRRWRLARVEALLATRGRLSGNAGTLALAYAPHHDGETTSRKPGPEAGGARALGDLAASVVRQARSDSTEEGYRHG